MSKFKVAHLADIHINNDPIWPTIIDRLHESLLKSKPDIVVIAGDLVDIKGSITPTGLQNLLLFMQKIKPNIIIEGNHDTNYYQNGTFIEIVCKQFPETEILKTTGIYERTYNTKRVVFGHISKIDHKVLTNETKHLGIGLFHEDFSGAEYDNNTPVKPDIKLLSTKNFVNFHAIFGGHIHKHQILNNNVVYPGSLIQQNKGESHEYHGYVLWTFDNAHNFKLTYKSIYNENAYVTVRSNSVACDDVENFVDKLPKNVQGCRIILDSNDNKHNNCLEHSLNKKYNNKVDVIVKEGVATYINSSVKTVENKFDLDSSIQEILENAKLSTNGAFIDKCKREIMAKNLVSCNLRRTVRLHNLSFINAYCYGDNRRNTINFNTMKNDISGIIAKNGYGKSSILKLIKFMLDVTVARTSSVEFPVLKGRKAGDATLTFSIEQNGAITLYTLFKKFANVNEPRTSAKLEICHPDGSKETMTEITPIKNYLKNVAELEDICTNAFVNQNEFNNLFEKNTASRNTFIKFLNLQQFDAAYTTYRKALDELKDTHNVLRNKNAASFTPEYLAKLKENLSNLTLEQKNLQDKVKVLEQMSEDTTKQNQKISSINALVTNIKNQLTKLNKKITFKKISADYTSLCKTEKEMSAYLNELYTYINSHNQYVATDSEILKLENKLNSINVTNTVDIAKLNRMIGKYGLNSSQHSKNKDSVQLSALDKLDADLDRINDILVNFSNCKIVKTDQSLDELVAKYNRLTNETMSINSTELNDTLSGLNQKYTDISDSINELDKIINMFYEPGKIVASEVKEFCVDTYLQLKYEKQSIQNKIGNKCMQSLLSSLKNNQAIIDSYNNQEVRIFMDKLTCKGSTTCKRCEEIALLLQNVTGTNVFSVNIQKIKNDIVKINEDLRLFEELDVVEHKMFKYNIFYKGYVDVRADHLKKFNAIKQEMDNVRNIISNNNSIKVQIQNTANELYTLKGQIKLDLSTLLHDNLSMYEEYEEVKNKISVLKQQTKVEPTLREIELPDLQIVATTISRSSYLELNAIDNKIQACTNEIDTVTQYLEVNLESQFLTAMCELTSTKGLQLKILSSKINNIEKTVNSLLCQFKPEINDIKFNIDHTKNVISCEYNNGINLCYANGFTKAITSVALLIAIFNTSNSTVLSGLFLDESFANADTLNLRKVRKFIRNIEGPEIIFVITHSDTIGEEIEKLLEIEIIDGKSYIKNDH